MFLLLPFSSTNRDILAFDNGLARTPPMGWNSWNRFHTNINEQMIREMADAMVNTGMKNLGYEYINLDDGWEARTRDSSGNLQPDPVKFPNGMKALTDYVHSKGLKLGIYSDIGLKTCQSYPGSYGYEYKDANQFDEWEIDYVKMDYCDLAPGQQPVPSFTLMRDALMSTGRPIVYSIAEWGRTYPWLWGEDVGNLWRVAEDINDQWTDVVRILDYDANLYSFAGQGHWNDADILEVGNGGMTNVEYRSHFSMWSILAAPLIAGNDLRSMSPETKEILMAPEVIAVDQDMAGIQGRRVHDYGDKEVWARPLHDGSLAAALFNKGLDASDITVYWNDVGLQSENHASVRDLWARQDRGLFTESFTANVLSHGVVMIKIIPVAASINMELYTSLSTLIRTSGLPEDCSSNLYIDNVLKDAINDARTYSYIYTSSNSSDNIEVNYNVTCSSQQYVVDYWTDKINGWRSPKAENSILASRIAAHDLVIHYRRQNPPRKQYVYLYAVSDAYIGRFSPEYTQNIPNAEIRIDYKYEGNDASSTVTTSASTHLEPHILADEDSNITVTFLSDPPGYRFVGYWDLFQAGWTTGNSITFNLGRSEKHVAAAFQWRATVQPSDFSIWVDPDSVHTTANSSTTTTIRTNRNTTALLAAWGFNEGSGNALTDSSGNSNHGRTYGSPAWTDGKCGKALAFDGIDDYVKSTFHLPSEALTLSFWMKPASVSGFTHPIGLGGDQKATVYLSETSEQIAFKFNIDGILKESDIGPFTLDVWHHVAITYNGSSLRAYLNGTLAMSYAAAGVISYFSSNVVIGALDDAPMDAFNGTIDDVSIYDVALADAEIKGLYQLESVTFHCSNLPPGASCSFSPPSCEPMCKTLATIAASPLTAPGTYDIAVEGTRGELTRHTSFILTVSPSSTTTSSTTTTAITATTIPPTQPTTVTVVLVLLGILLFAVIAFVATRRKQA